MNEEGAAGKGPGQSAIVKPVQVAGLIPKARAAKPRKKDLSARTEQMAQLLRAGMRLSEVLDIMGRRSSNLGWRKVFEDLRSSVVGGKSLSEAMLDYPDLFNPLYRAMISAGEAAGHLVVVLERLAQYLQQRDAVQQRVISAMIYPCIIITAGMGVVIFFMVFMLPKLAQMFKDMGQALPLMTQVMIWASEFLINYGWLVLLGLGVAWVFFRHWLKDPQHRAEWDRRILGWPLVGNILSLSEQSRFTQTLATLLQSGVALLEALHIAEATLGNSALRFGVRDARVQVREGKSLSEALSGQKIFPELMVDMLSVGERTGDLAGAMQHTAQAYERDLDRILRTATSLIEPILIIGMAIFVGGIVMSVLLAVFDLTSGIGGQ
jgi:type II secretory pathway component PulF